MWLVSYTFIKKKIQYCTYNVQITNIYISRMQVFFLIYQKYKSRKKIEPKSLYKFVLEQRSSTLNLKHFQYHTPHKTIVYHGHINYLM